MGIQRQPLLSLENGVKNAASAFSFSFKLAFEAEILIIHVSQEMSVQPQLTKILMVGKIRDQNLSEVWSY